MDQSVHHVPRGACVVIAGALCRSRERMIPRPQPEAATSDHPVIPVRQGNKTRP